jgi:signal transduction histidine kinase
MPLGSRFPLEKGTDAELVARTEAPGRIDAYGATVGASEFLTAVRDMGKRMLDFTDLVATAIANADSHAKLQASRARVLAAADATRRLIERDLHDGTQQRQVAVMLELRAMEARPPADPEEFRRLLSDTTHALDEALEDLRGLRGAFIRRSCLGRASNPRSRRSHAALPSRSSSTCAPTGIWRSGAK